MLDQYKRDISYLRISVTDRCNSRCIYCIPDDALFKKDHKENVSFDEIVKVSEAAASIGINKIRLTGGEPLKKAGLDSINISLDTLDPDRYKKLTRIGDISKVLDGISAAQKAGFKKIKINMVVMEDTGDKEIEAMKTFCKRRGLELQLINHYELSRGKSDAYTFDRPPKCSVCNRIRLTADGHLKPCLHPNREIILNAEDLTDSLKTAVLSKPVRGKACINRSMIEIGG